MTDRHYYRELKTGYQDFRVVAVVIRLSNPFFHHRAQKNNFTRFASGVIFSSFIVLFTFDGVAILKYITVVHTSLFTMVSRSQLSIDDNIENLTIEISLS